MRHRRRSCAKLCRAAGGELEQIQLLLGHASVQTTERYLVNEAAVRHYGYSREEFLRMTILDIRRKPLVEDMPYNPSRWELPRTSH